MPMGRTTAGVGGWAGDPAARPSGALRRAGSGARGLAGLNGGPCRAGPHRLGPALGARGLFHPGTSSLTEAGGGSCAMPGQRWWGSIRTISTIPPAMRLPGSYRALGCGHPIVEHLAKVDRAADTGFTFNARRRALRGMGTFPVRARAGCVEKARMNLTADIALAQRLADAAGAAIRPHFRQPLDAERRGRQPGDCGRPRGGRGDACDPEGRAARMMRCMARNLAPRRAKQGRTWVLDPIDGTTAFLAGRALFGTLIALVVEGWPVLGVIDQPIAGERWVEA